MSGTEDKEWFYMLLGHRRGPKTQDKLREMLLNEELFIESTQVWCEGMKDWENLDECKAFSSTVKKVREAAQKADANVRHASSSTSVDEDIVCRGVSRALYNFFIYLGWTIPMFIGVAVIAELQVHQLLGPTVVAGKNLQYIIPIGFLMLVLSQLSVSRMRHAGFPAWMGITILVPVVNIFILLICLFAPQNFKRKKKLGKQAIGYVLLFIAMVSLPFTGLLAGVSPASLNILSLTDTFTDGYKYQTSFKARMKKNEEKALSAEARRKAMEENSKKQGGREGALRERQKELD